MKYHIIPRNDDRAHTEREDCWCGPRVEWIDPETNMPYSNGCLVIHHAADCREIVEELVPGGGPLASDKDWISIELDE